LKPLRFLSLVHHEICQPSSSTLSGLFSGIKYEFQYSAVCEAGRLSVDQPSKCTCTSDTQANCHSALFLPNFYYSKVILLVGVCLG
ncbi:MAG: hypothetical protein WBL25_09020, partial [Anaerolineales bacterium]